VLRSTLSGEKLKQAEEVITASEQEVEDKLEIFEAGTGHGALTLHLARAIYSANAPSPPIPSSKINKKPNIPHTSEISFKPTGDGLSKDADAKVWGEEHLYEETQSSSGESLQELAYENYLLHRRAIIQTLDISPVYSAHAQKTISYFRKGIYYPHINFHVGTIPDYLSSRLSENNNKPFFSHAILDLPNTQDYLEIVGQATKPDGNLVTWNPSITQIMKCIEVVKEKRLPWVLEKVLEVGLAAGVGGREWDVRAVRPRAIEKALAKEAKKAEDEEETDDTAALESPVDNNTGWEMICRPKVGLRIEGGGFVGLWKRMDVY